MAQYLSISELQELQRCLIKNLSTNKIGEKEKSNEEYVSIFLNAKRLEGCTGQTLAYYERTLNHFIKQISVPIMEIDSEDIREYLSSYQKQRGCSKATLDNIRRNLNRETFVSHTWRSNENYVRRMRIRS